MAINNDFFSTFKTFYKVYVHVRVKCIKYGICSILDRFYTLHIQCNYDSKSKPPPVFGVDNASLTIHFSIITLKENVQEK